MGDEWKRGGGGGIVQAVAIVLSISSMSDCPPVTSNLPTDKNSCMRSFFGSSILTSSFIFKCFFGVVSVIFFTIYSKRYS